MSIVQAVKDFIFAAANALYKEAGRSKLPTVAEVRTRVAADVKEVSTQVAAQVNAVSAQDVTTVVDAWLRTVAGSKAAAAEAVAAKVAAAATQAAEAVAAVAAVAVAAAEAVATAKAAAAQFASLTGTGRVQAPAGPAVVTLRPEDPPAAFYFSVSFSDQAKDADSSFREVSGISPEMETEPVIEGGENRYVLALPKGVKHPRLVLKRGIAPNTSDLLKWCTEVLGGGFAEPIKTKMVLLSLLNSSGEPLRTWSFADAYPVKMAVEAFNSTKNEVAVETIELSYSYSTRGL